MRHQVLLPAVAPSGTLDLGVGFNWFDFLGSGGVYARWNEYPLSAQIYPELNDADGWEALWRELDALRPGWIRFGLPPDRILDAGGELITDSPHFERLERIARWCEQRGVEVMLDTFVIPERFEFSSPPHSGTSCLNMAARDNRAYAEEFVAPLLHYIVIERGLRAVRSFNPVNEPIHYGVYQTPAEGPDVFRHYVEMYAELRRALDLRGLNNLKLIGVDKDLPFDFPVFEYLARGIDIDPYVNAYAIHSYRSRFDYAPETALLPESDPLRTLVDMWVRRLVRYTESRGKPLLACEVGAFYYGQREGDPAGPATPEGALLTAETIIRMINVGVRGALVWSPLNPNTIDGWWRMFTIEGQEVVREPHTYPTLGLLMRFMPAGSSVYPLAPQAREYPQYVWGSLLHAPDGELHLVLINDHPHEPRAISVTLPQSLAGRPLRKFVKDRIRLGATEPTLVRPDGAGSFNDQLPALSLQVYTTEIAATWHAATVR